MPTGNHHGIMPVCSKATRLPIVPLKVGPSIYSEALANAGAGPHVVLQVTVDGDVVGSDHEQDAEVMGEAPLLEDAEHEPEPVLDGVVRIDGEDCPGPSSSSSSSSSSSEPPESIIPSSS